MPTTNDDAVIILETPDIADISIFAEDPAQLDMDTIERGPAGRDATINGVNTLTLVAERGLDYTQDGDTLTLFVDPATQEDIDEATDQYKPITPSQLYYAIVRGLAYNNLSFTSTERAAALDWLGVNDSTITLTQGGETKGSFTLNQDGDATIELDDGQTIQLEEMPEASEEYVGPIYQYIGIDTQNYTHGYFYECVEVSQDTYEWQQTDVQPIKSTYMTYPASWPTNSTTKAFCDAIAIDTTAVVGKAYLGEVTFTDISSLGLGNAEVVVEIMSGTTASDKVIVLTMNSGNVSPYLWRYTYWNHGTNVSGWIGFQPKLTAGDGIELLNNTISAVGLRNKNTVAGATNPIYDWVGTLAEFTAQNVATQHPDWICYITDDEGGNGVIYTAAECNTLFTTKTELATALLDKANTNADNFTTAGKTFLSTLSLPAFTRYDSLTILASGNSYTAPANGWFYAKGQTLNSNAPAVIYLHGPLIDGRQTTLGGWAPPGATGRIACCIYPVTTGTSVEFVYGNSTTNLMLVFIYANGNPGGEQ